MTMLRKTIPASAVRIKNADAGEVEVVFATLDVIDKGDDVICKGAITDGAPVVVSAYGHKSWDGELPVGTGTIHEVGNELVARTKFLLDTPHGEATFRTVKALAEKDLGEWSFGLLNVVGERGVKDGRKVQFIKSVDVPEVSPVLLGEGVNTRTTAVKSAKQLASSLRRLLTQAARARWVVEGDAWWVYLEDYDVDDEFAVFTVEYRNEANRMVQVSFTRTDTSVELGEEETEVHETSVFLAKSGSKFSEHAASVLADVDELVTRTREVVALRAAKGKTISDDSAGVLADVSDRLEQVKSLLSPNTDTGPGDGANPPSDDVGAEWFRFQQSIATSQGVTTS